MTLTADISAQFSKTVFYKIGAGYGLSHENGRSPSENDLDVFSNACRVMSPTTKISEGILPAKASAHDGYYTRPRFIFYQRITDQTHKFI